MSPEGAASLRKTLTGLDLVSAKGTVLGFGAVGLPTVGSVGSFVPAASAGYLAYSTARNPAATYKAAAELIKAYTKKGKAMNMAQKIIKGDGRHLAEMAAAFHQKHPGDWADAVLAACIEETGNLVDGIEAAEATLRRTPRHRPTTSKFSPGDSI